MKKELVDVEEHEHVACKCGNLIFSVERWDNYCEMGPAMRLFCFKCGLEKDYRLRDVIKHEDEINVQT